MRVRELLDYLENMNTATADMAVIIRGVDDGQEWELDLEKDDLEVSAQARTVYISVPDA
jgi:hypothetical protein